MRAVIQRVAGARVTVDGSEIASVEAGLLILLGVGIGDDAALADRLAGKIARLRILASADGKMDDSLLDTGGEALVVSQFTLFADTTRGNRPGFSAAARPEVAEPLYVRFCEALRAEGVPVRTGLFGARMAVELTNDGPVTLIIDA